LLHGQFRCGFNHKSERRLSHNIEFITKIKVNSVDFDAIGICRILGNALDNAVEACVRTEVVEKYVCIAMYQLDNKLIVEIENTSLPVDVNNLITSKKNKSAHGIGMQSIKQTVASMNGFFTYNYNNGYFSIKIVLNK